MLVSAYRGSIAASAALIAEYITTPEAHGLTDPNDPADVRAAFASAIADASAHAHLSSTGRGVVELVPGKVYTCMAATNGANGRQEGAIVLTAATPNVEIRTQGKPEIGGNQAILRNPSWAPLSGVHNRAILAARSAVNVTIGWVELDGNYLSCGASYATRRTWLKNNVVYTQGGNGGLYNISLIGIQGLRAYHVHSHSALNDGMVLRGGHDNSGNPGFVTTDVIVEDCDFHHCRRLCGTMEGLFNTNDPADSILYRRCTYRFGGETADIPGEAPGGSFDLEPLSQGHVVYGVTFDDCDFTDANGFTLEFGNDRGHDLGRGFDHTNNGFGRRMKWTNCRFERNRFDGLVFVINHGTIPQCVDFEISNCKFRDNGSQFGTPNYIAFVGFSQGTNIATLNPLTAINNEFTVGGSPNGGYNFRPECADAGHAVTIWKGDYQTTVIDNGQSTITLNDGFPS